MMSLNTGRIRLNQLVLMMLISTQFCFAQKEEYLQNSYYEKYLEEYDYFEPEIREDIEDIWDKENSNKSFKIETIGYDDIPKNIEFRGRIVVALKWTDSNGENILIQSVSGVFKSKDYNVKSEIFAYLFQKSKSNNFYERKWRVYDYQSITIRGYDEGYTPYFRFNCSRFNEGGTTITDIDNDGIAEISLPYLLNCSIDSPCEFRKKIIMYEGSTKYALRGTSKFCLGNYEAEPSRNSDFEPSKNLKTNKKFMEFLESQWFTYECKYY